MDLTKHEALARSELPDTGSECRYCRDPRPDGSVEPFFDAPMGVLGSHRLFLCTGCEFTMKQMEAIGKAWSPK